MNGVNQVSSPAYGNMGKHPGLSRTVYENALRNGATSACLFSATASGCYLGLLKEPVRPNFTDGYGVVKASNSLALIPP